MSAPGTTTNSTNSMGTAMGWLVALILVAAAPPVSARRPADDAAAPRPRVLVLTHSAGYRHDVVKRDASGLSLVERALLDATRDTHDLVVTQDCSWISAADLADFDAVVAFTSGELPLPEGGLAALLAFVRSGGGLLGVHSASDTLYEAPEWGRLIGGVFDGHPWREEVSLRVEVSDHPATRHLGETWTLSDEIYQFRAFDREAVDVLLSLDATTADGKGKREDDDYALAWCRREGAGRVAYTALGHEPALWRDATFLTHVRGALDWTLGERAPGTRPQGDGTPGDGGPTSATRADDQPADRGLVGHAAQQDFLNLCARCHGVDGSGAGDVVLDRPARSFKDGGFSFGNTKVALMRSIANGIPGTPMPAFDLLSEDERRNLADYVQRLGPPVTATDREAGRLVVGDEALVVRGILAPVSAEAALVTRGLLAGTPDGLSFEYRLDDVRLLAVRSGAFALRADWTGRGGATLEPEGVIVHLMGGGAPAATFAVAASADALSTPALMAGPAEVTPLHARSTGSRIEGDRFVLTYDLVGPDGLRLVRVEESARAYPSPVGSGWVRNFRIESTSVERRIALWIGSAAEGDPVEEFVTGIATTPGQSARDRLVREPPKRWRVNGPLDGETPVFVVRGMNTNGQLLSTRDGVRLFVSAPERAKGPPLRLELIELLAPAWDAETSRTFQADQNARAEGPR